jgi:molecular chaperone Hsp33
MSGGAARITRNLILGREAVFVRAEIEALFAAYLAHVDRWESVPDGLAQTMMRQALGAAALHMTTRPPDEMTAWTLNIKQPPLNLFFTARNHDSSVAGRVFTENVRTTEESRFFVETLAPGREPSRSAIEVKGLDVLQIFEQYYDQSEQNPARFFELSEYDLLMVLGLPDVDRRWLASLDRESAIAVSTESPRPVDMRAFEFRCGCDSERMLAVMRGLYDGKADALFQGEEGVEVLCPRCGHRWWIARKDF